MKAGVILKHTGIDKGTSGREIKIKIIFGTQIFKGVPDKILSTGVFQWGGRQIQTNNNFIMAPVCWLKEKSSKTD